MGAVLGPAVGDPHSAAVPEVPLEKISERYNLSGNERTVFLSQSVHA